MTKDQYEAKHARQPETQPVGRIVFETREDKYPKGRAIAAVYWISYFALHWLLILEVAEFTTARGFCTIYFLTMAVLTTMIAAASEAVEAKKEEKK